MRDNEIIKAFKHYNWYKDNDITTTCVKSVLLRDAYYLMCRQQAEIERLKKTNPLFEYATKSVHQYIEDGQTYYLDFVNEEREAEAISKKIDYLCNIQDIRAEAIKEFAEKLKAEIFDEFFYEGSQDKFLLSAMVDGLVKEMGCGKQ